MNIYDDEFFNFLTDLEQKQKGKLFKKNIPCVEPFEQFLTHNSSGYQNELNKKLKEIDTALKTNDRMLFKKLSGQYKMMMLEL